MARNGGGNRILNLTRRTLIKRHQAVSRIEAFTAVWVERNVSIRELTLPEVLALRAAHKESPESGRSPGCGLYTNELPGFYFQRPAKDQYKGLSNRWPLLAAAQFLQGQLGEFSEL